MTQRIKVYFGKSTETVRDVCIIEQGEPVDFLEIEGETLPIYREEVEKKLNEEHMQFELYDVSKRKLSHLENMWKEAVELMFTRTATEGDIKRAFLKFKQHALL